MLKKYRGVLMAVVPTVGVFAAGSVHAAAFDTTAALAAFTDVTATIPVVGAAFLGVLGLLAAWKLIRGAFA